MSDNPSPARLTLKVGLGPSVNRYDTARPVAPQIAEMIETVRTSAEAGFGYVAGSHHWLAPGFLPPLLCFARLIPEAPSLDFHTSVYLLPQQNPYEVADQVAALDMLCGGRLVLGVGLGYRELEFAAAGIAKRDRVRRLEEAIDLLRALWSGEPGRADAPHRPVQNVQPAVLPLQRPGVPILIGSQNPAGAARAGRLADGWVIWGMYTLSDIRAHRPLYLRARHESGRPGPGMIELKRYIHIAPTHAQAVEEARAYIEGYWNNPFYQAGGLRESGRVALDIPWEQTVSERAVVGTPDEVIAALQAQIDEFQISRLALSWRQPEWDHTRYMQAIRTLGREVVPHLRPAAGLASV